MRISDWSSDVCSSDLIATRSGGRLGVAALDTGSGRRIGHDQDARYALCSTFKAPLAAAILARVDAGAIALDDRLAFTDADVLDYAQVVKAHRAGHAPTVGEAFAGEDGRASWRERGGQDG